MASRTYRTVCVVLDKTKLKETDLILTLLSERGSQIRAVAKGARKPGSKLSARCDLFNCVDVLLARGRTLDVVSQAELLHAPLGVNPDYESISAASVVSDVAQLCCYEEAEDPFVFAITTRCLELLGRVVDQPHRDVLVAAFIFKLLSHVGYRPDYTACVSCSDPSLSYFSSSAGGLLCASCAATVAGAEPVDGSTVQWLRALLSLRFDELLSHEIDLPRSTMLLALAHSWAATHMDARIRSLEFLMGH